MIQMVERIDNTILNVTNESELSVLLSHLYQLHPGQVQHLPLTELEWILIDFVWSKGQQLKVNSTTRPSEARLAALHTCGTVYLPFASMADFPRVSPDQVRLLAQAAACIHLYVLFQDEIIDDPGAASVVGKVAIPHLLHRFYLLVGKLFPASSPFWAEFEQCMARTSQAICRECQRHREMVQPYSLDEFQLIAYGKMALLQFNCVGLALLNNTPQYIPVLSECWNAIGLAAIIQDDISDWQEDYQNANYSYLLSQVLLSSPFKAEVENGRLPDVAEVGAALFCSNLMESLYRLACEHLECAAHTATTINCFALANIIRQMQTGICTKPAELFEHKMAELVAMKGLKLS